MDNLIFADISYFHNERLGVMTDNITGQSHIAGTSVVDSIELLGTAVLVTTYLIGAFLISPMLTIVAACMALSVTLAMQYFIKRAKQLSESAVTLNNDYQVDAVEILSGIEVIKAFVIERVRGSSFNNKAGLVGDIEFLQARNHARMVVLQELVFFCMIGGILYVGVSILHINIAVIIAFLFILYRLMPRVVALNSFRHNLAESLARVKAVSRAMEIPAAKSITSGGSEFDSLQDGVVLSGVEFSYTDKSPALSGVYFKIPKGKMTAIVGHSGAGKSTLIHLLLRHYDPSDGVIYVDGIDLKDLNLESWLGRIGVVSQDTFLFNDTVA